MTSEWLYKNQPFTVDQAEGYYGFIYLITNKLDGKKYVGRKYLTRAATKQVNGKKKKIRKESDWQNYWSSSDLLKEQVKTLGEENFTREILYLCKTRSECNYMETREIFIRDALLKEEYINSWVSCKIHKAHVFDKFEV
jgi:hypothetical protein